MNSESTGKRDVSRRCVLFGKCFNNRHIQPAGASNVVSVVFAGGADFVFLFRKTDANVGADELPHVVACVGSNKSVFDEADGNG
jgi:hypothetical protein